MILQNEAKKSPPKLPQRKIYFWILSNAKSVPKRTDVSVINFANDLKCSCFNVKCKYFRHIMFPIHLVSLVHYTESYAIFHPLSALQFKRFNDTVCLSFWGMLSCMIRVILSLYKVHNSHILIVAHKFHWRFLLSDDKT